MYTDNASNYLHGQHSSCPPRYNNNGISIVSTTSAAKNTNAALTVSLVNLFDDEL